MHGGRQYLCISYYRLECAARAHLFQLFQHLAHRPVHLRRDCLLFRVWQLTICLAQVAVDDGLDRRIVTSVCEVISAAERCVETADVLYGQYDISFEDSRSFRW